MTDTPVMRAYAEWRQSMADWQAATQTDHSEETTNAWCERTYGLADAIVTLPSAGPLDFIHKLMAYTYDGEHDVGDGDLGPLIWAEARSFLSDAPAPADPVAEAGRALAAALRAEDAADEAMIAARGTEDRTALDAAHIAAQQHVFDLRKALGQHRATTLEGCLYQLAEASQIVEAMANSMGDGRNAWATEEEARARRCLYSVATVLQGLTEKRLDPDMGMGALMPEALSPWREEAEAVE